MTSDPYRHLLVAVDFAPESEPVLARAVALRERFGARLTLVNVVDYVSSGAEYTGGAFIADPVLPEDMEVEHELLAAAAQQMDLLGERLGIPPGDRIVESGPTGRSILNVAQDLKVDLIVVGAHDHNWLSRLFGSTSRTLLAREPCDLLAVRIPKDDGPAP